MGGDKIMTDYYDDTYTCGDTLDGAGVCDHCKFHSQIRKVINEKVYQYRRELENIPKETYIKNILHNRIEEEKIRLKNLEDMSDKYNE
jgi:hypothetical protein